MKPKMSAAPSSASKSKALQTLIPCVRTAAPLVKSYQTANRSVTRVNDKAGSGPNQSLPLMPD